jgi:hypothetical protein
LQKFFSRRTDVALKNRFAALSSRLMRFLVKKLSTSEQTWSLDKFNEYFDSQISCKDYSNSREEDYSNYYG